LATNLSIDPDLIELALEVSDERTKKAAVTNAASGQCGAHGNSVD
jgi:hypothetical protein